MLLNKNGFTPSESPAGVPLIGYKNKATSYVATSESTGHSASNMGNPATSSTWQSTSSGAQRVQVVMGGQSVNYLAIAKHSLFDTTSSIALSYTDNADSAAGSLRSLLHFEAADATTFMLDSSGNDEPWAVNGNAQIDTTQFKFGASSLLLDGTGDYLTTYGGQFAVGTRDFTMDFWVRFNSITGQNTLFDARANNASVALCVYLDTGSSPPVISYYTNNAPRIAGTTGIVTGQWYHVALSRVGTNTRLFVNGVLQGALYVDANDYNVANTHALAKLGALLDGSLATNGWIDEFRFVDGTGYFTAGFAVPTAAYSDGTTRMFTDFSSLLNFEGANGSTVMTDSGGEGHAWTPHGSAQIDTAQFKFGASSLHIPGVTTDFITGDGSDAFAFGLGDYTVDFWFRLTVNNTFIIFYDTRISGGDVTNLLIYMNNGPIIVQGIITGSTTPTTGVWHHLAVSRSGGTTRLFLDGVQEGASVADSRNYTIRPSQPAVGNSALGENAGIQGWVDAVRVTKGTGIFTHNFVVPQSPAHALSQGGKISVADAAPIIFRFPAIATGYLVMSLSSAITGALVHTIAVVYAGEILALERGVKVDAQHLVINYARKTDLVSGMSENGQFLGRVILSEWREATADFAWFTPAWYRANFEPFVKSAIEVPFFWVWNPSEYPAETAFAWLSEDVRPDTDPATRRVAATISMRALA